LKEIAMSRSHTVSIARPDVDIHADVNNLILHYPPLASDQHQIRILVANGVVHLGGHVRSTPSRRYLIDAIPTIQGVTGVNDAALYDEDMLRLEIGKVLPTGLQVNMRYGTAILSGKLPDGTSEEELVKLASLPGVERVVVNF